MTGMTGGASHDRYDGRRWPIIVFGCFAGIPVAIVILGRLLGAAVRALDAAGCGAWGLALLALSVPPSIGALVARFVFGLDRFRCVGFLCGFAVLFAAAAVHTFILYF